LVVRTRHYTLGIPIFVVRDIHLRNNLVCGITLLEFLLAHLALDLGHLLCRERSNLARPLLLNAFPYVLLFKFLLSHIRELVDFHLKRRISQGVVPFDDSVVGSEDLEASESFLFGGIGFLVFGYEVDVLFFYLQLVWLSLK
jgi:hypothetical protein